MRTCDTLKETPKARLHRWALCLGLPILFACGELAILMFCGTILIGISLAAIILAGIIINRSNRRSIASAKLSCSVFEGNVSSLAHLLAAGSIDRSKLSELLFHACYGGHAEIATLLLDHGAPVNENIRIGPAVVTPLFIASLCAHSENIKLLLARGADPDIECVMYGEDGSQIIRETARQLAVERNHL